MPRRDVALGFVMAGLAVGLVAPVADASLVRVLALSELTVLADRIVVADVLSVRAEWDGAHRNIYTSVEVAVSEGWKGEVPSDGRLSLRQLGGVVGDIEMTVLGTATFTPGERAVLFLRQAQVVGMAQGKRRLRWEPEGRQWLVEGADAASVVALDGRGKARPASPEPPEPLDRLRARVAKLMGR